MRLSHEISCCVCTGPAGLFRGLFYEGFISWFPGLVHYPADSFHDVMIQRITFSLEKIQQPNVEICYNKKSILFYGADDLFIYIFRRDRMI